MGYFHKKLKIVFLYDHFTHTVSIPGYNKFQKVKEYK